MRPISPALTGYEQVLRVIGRHLDAEPAARISVEEQPTGFMVSSYSSGRRGDVRTIHYSWERLSDLAVYQAAGIGVPRRHVRGIGMWQTLAFGHEVFFRALGRRLDHEGARDLVIDEGEEGVAVAYARPDAQALGGMQTVYEVLHREDVETLLLSVSA